MKKERCPICSGATTCPAEDFKGLHWHLPPVFDIPNDYIWVRPDDVIEFAIWPLNLLSGIEAERLCFTHSRKYSSTFILKAPAHSSHDFHFVEVGTAQKARIEAHYPDAKLYWAGQCRYIGLVSSRPEDLRMYYVTEKPFEGVSLLPINTNGESPTLWAYENTAELIEACRKAGHAPGKKGAVIITNGPLGSRGNILKADIRGLWAIHDDSYTVAL